MNINRNVCFYLKKKPIIGVQAEKKMLVYLVALKNKMQSYKKKILKAYS